MDYYLLKQIEVLEDERLLLEEVVFLKSFDEQHKTMKYIEDITILIERLSKDYSKKR